jgi:hypothetical protein
MHTFLDLRTVTYEVASVVFTPQVCTEKYYWVAFSGKRLCKISWNSVAWFKWNVGQTDTCRHYGGPISTASWRACFCHVGHTGVSVQHKRFHTMLGIRSETDGRHFSNTLTCQKAWFLTTKRWLLRERDAGRRSQSCSFEDDWFLNATHVRVAQRSSANPAASFGSRIRALTSARHARVL